MTWMEMSVRAEPPSRSPSRESDMLTWCLNVVPCCPLPSMIRLVQEAEKNLQITRMGNPRMVQVRSDLDILGLETSCEDLWGENCASFVPRINWLRKFRVYTVYTDLYIYIYICRTVSTWLSQLAGMHRLWNILNAKVWPIMHVMYVGFFHLD